MPFADTSLPTRSQTKKTKYLALDGGNYTIRILDPVALCVNTHYINKISVQCLGEDCPICNNNRRLIMENPNSFRDSPEYSPRTRRYLVNVLDKSLVKKCPKCGTETHDLTSVGAHCPSCGEMLFSVQPVPSNTVKVLAKGVQVFDQLNSIDLSIIDPKTGEPIGITKYDVVLRVTGSGKNKIITPIPMPGNNEPVDPNLEKFDLEKLTIKFTPEEMLDLQRGVSARDLLSARSANSTTAFSSVPDKTQQIAADAVKKLFEN